MLNRQLASTQTLQLAGLHTLDIFCTPLEARFERLTRLARVALGVRVAGITIFHQDQVWFKSVIGWTIQELPIQDSFCKLLIDSRDPLVIEDTRLEPRLRDHPLIEQAPRFRFYAGFPLRDRQNNVLGSLCVFDTKPRALEPIRLQALYDLGELAQRELLTDALRDAQAALVAKLDIDRRRAMIDVLTRIYNRRAGLEFLDKAIARSERDGSPLSVCMLDCDLLKTVNDRHGHAMGDRYLRELSTILVGSLREDDIVCRLGGDEFMVLMPATDREAALQAMERLEARLAEFPLRIPNGTIPFQVSMGVATRTAGHELTATQLIEEADQSMFKVKAARRQAGGGRQPASHAVAG